MKLILALLAATIAIGTSSVRAADVVAPPSFVVKVTGKGKPVILIPGLSCSGAVWDGTVAHLKDHYECHVLTLAGFAGQPRIEPPFLETVRNDLAKYIRSHKLDHPVIIGHSLGGFTADWLGAHDPDLVGALIIVDALPFLPAAMNRTATADSVKPMAEQIRAGIAASQESFLANSETSIRGMVTKPADFELVMTWVKASDRVAVGNAFYDLFTHDLRSDIASIKSPVLVLGTWVSYKDYTTRDAVEVTTRKQYAAVKNCKVVMAETRHFIMLDDPEWFYKQVDSFLAANR
jgi:pimeloyl-ACP methyl ester carboxylesterase